MNKRILQFAEQAGSTHKQNLGVYQFYTNELEKFAELIVRECMRYFNEDYQRDFDVKWREDLSEGIKQHFGVEE